MDDFTYWWEDWEDPEDDDNDEDGDGLPSPDDDDLDDITRGIPFPSEFEDGDPIDEELLNPLDYLMDIDSVDPTNIRGIAFATLEECISWMQEIGVISFSSAVYMGGAYHPVIGESIGPGGDTSESDEQEREPEPIPF